MCCIPGAVRADVRRARQGWWWGWQTLKVRRRWRCCCTGRSWCNGWGAATVGRCRPGPVPGRFGRCRWRCFSAFARRWPSAKAAAYQCWLRWAGGSANSPRWVFSHPACMCARHAPYLLGLERWCGACRRRRFQNPGLPNGDERKTPEAIDTLLPNPGGLVWAVVTARSTEPYKRLLGVDCASPSAGSPNPPARQKIVRIAIGSFLKSALWTSTLICLL